MDGTFEATPAMDEALARVGRGEVLTITAEGRPVAKLQPIDSVPLPGSPGSEQAFKDLRNFPERHALRGLNAKELIDEGKKGL